MKTIYDILAQAQALRNETKLDSVSPERLGAIHEETLKYINEYQLLASSPAIHKVYASVSLMQGDSSPKSDITGRYLTKGQLVVIVPTSVDATAGDIYRYDGPSGNTSSWTYVAKIGGVPADKEFNINSTNPLQNGVITEKFEKIEDQSGRYDLSNEYIRAYTDSAGRFLWGIRTTGEIEFAKGVPTPVRDYIESNFLRKENQPLSYINDEEERIELTIDENSRVVAYREKTGRKVEYSMAVVNSLDLGIKAMNQLQQDLRASGFELKTPTDWSSAPMIKLPLPRSCAKVNIISKTGLATTKTDDIKCVLEYWDKDGNYFKKFIILNAQGASSMAYYEKNQSIDIYNDENYTDSCDIIFGNWVAQDSFHLKCYYIDVFRGIANIGYNICEEAIEFLNSRNNRIALDSSNITAYESTGKFDVDFGDGALCHPDGFPFELYLNGEYYGLFAWNLKKHRKNYSMNKKDYTAALLDGKIGYNEFFCGTIDWTAFELRNPKDLITMDGQKYDADTNCNELIDASSPYYDSNNANHVNTAKIKAILVRQSQAIPQIISESDTTLARELFERYYDVNAMICYFIMSNVIYNYDGFWKNWVWTVYNNIAAPSFYDLDSIFGRAWNGLSVEAASFNSITGVSDNIPTGQLYRLYFNEIRECYKLLRDSDVISLNNLMRHISQWISRVGTDAYNRNIEKWPSIPSYRSYRSAVDGTAEGGFYDSPKRIKKWLTSRLELLDKTFKYE